MEQVVPWPELLALVEHPYPKAGKGRQPVGLTIMLWTYFLQQGFSLSDPGMEEAFYDSAALRRFAGVDLGLAGAPDETTILRFCHLREQHELCGKMLDTVNLYLDRKGIRIGTGTVVDATSIQAPSSTKNSTGKRDPQMHQTRKGQQWYFGAKAHIRVDSKEVVVHSLATTAASVADKHMLPDLLYGGEKKVWGDAGYQGQTEAIHEAASDAQDTLVAPGHHRVLPLMPEFITPQDSAESRTVSATPPNAGSNGTAEPCASCGPSIWAMRCSVRSPCVRRFWPKAETSYLNAKKIAIRRSTSFCAAPSPSGIR